MEIPEVKEFEEHFFHVLTDKHSFHLLGDVYSFVNLCMNTSNVCIGTIVGALVSSLEMFIFYYMFLGFFKNKY